MKLPDLSDAESTIHPRRGGSVQATPPLVVPSHSDATGNARRSWSYLRTPLPVFLIVMTPINGLMLFLITTSTPFWMKATSTAVILFSIVSLFRGYARRLVLTTEGPALVRPWARRVLIPWREIRRIDVCVPGGGVNGSMYLYITSRNEPPAGTWDIDARTIQIQNRDGILDIALAAWKESKPGPTDRNAPAPNHADAVPAESRPATPPK